MKILVYPHDLNLGGSQINAIDLAAAAASGGNDVIVYGIDGPLVSYIESRGLQFVPARRLRFRPAPSRSAQLWNLVRREGVDVVHTYEWPPCLDAYYGPHLMGGTPVVCTVLSMSVSPLVPDSVPLIMGTEQLGDEVRKTRSNVSVLEPPIDTDADYPGIDGSSFRREHSVASHETLIVTVSRLAIELKFDALVDAIDAAGILSSRHQIRLVIVGEGEARPQLQARADAINEAAGRQIITLPGSLMDPRRAYAAADIVVGMGSSALRAAAIGSPVIVQGERGFSLPLTPDTVDTFLYQGFWGIGDGTPAATELANQLDDLIADSRRRAAMGIFGRSLIEQRFSLKRASSIMSTIYESLVHDRRTTRPITEPAVMAGRAFQLEMSYHRPLSRRSRSGNNDKLPAATGEPGNTNSRPA